MITPNKKTSASAGERGVSAKKAAWAVAVVAALAAAAVFAVSHFLGGAATDPLAQRSRQLTGAEKGEAEAAVVSLVEGGGTFGYDAPDGVETLAAWRERLRTCSGPGRTRIWVCVTVLARPAPTTMMRQV